MEILNGIVMVILGLCLSAQGPAICDRHGEHGLAIGVGVSGYVVATVGALNVMYGLECEPDGVSSRSAGYHDPGEIYRLGVSDGLARCPDTVTAPVKPDTLYWTPCRVEVWTRHDLGYVADTVTALAPPIRSNQQWYVKGDSGRDYWSDRFPVTINTEK
jgi:hypothetical protein